MILGWRHNRDEGQWELIQDVLQPEFHGDDIIGFLRGIDIEPQPVVLCVVRDEVVTGIELGLEGLRALIAQSHPDWPGFPDKETRDKRKGPPHG